MKRHLLLVLCLLVLSSCRRNEICVQSPAILTFSFVNEEGQNMIANKQLPEHMIEFKKELGGNQNKTIPFTLDAEDRVVLQDLDLTDTSQQYKFLSLIHSFVFVINAQKPPGCNGFDISDVLFRDVETTQRADYIEVKLVRR